MAPDLSWKSAVERVLQSDTPDLELALLIAQLRAENQRQGGDDRTFSGILAGHAALLASSFPLKPIGGSQ